MAGQTNRIEVEIVAVDEASPKIDKLTKRIDGLEADEARIVIKADISKLDKQLTDALAKMQHLEGDELTVHTRMVGNLEQDLIDAQKLFDQLDGQTGTVRIDADTTDLDQGLAKAKAGTEGLSDSARGANNALANMIGNTTQDLGAMGGVAGSAGVAIGQMAEFAADAALGGEAVAGALGSMVAVAGPIALLTVGVGLLSTALHKGDEEAKQIAEDTNAYADALIRARDAGEDVGTAVDTAALEKTDDFFTGLGDKLPKTLDALSKLGFTYGDVVQAFESGTGPVAKALTDFRSLSTEIDRIKFNEFVDTNDALILFAQRTGQSEAAVRQRYYAEKALNDVLGDQAELSAQSLANAQALDEFRAGVQHPTEQQVIQDSIDQANALKRQSEMQRAANTQLQDYLDLLDRRHAQGVEQRQAIAERDALAQLNTAEQDLQRHREDRARDAKRLSSEEVEAIHDVTAAVGELAEAQDQIEENALVKVFGDRSTRLDALTTVQNINQEIRDLATFIKTDLKGVIPDIFDPNDVNADDLLNKVSGLRTQIQERISAAFAAGGEAAAIATANSFVNTIAKQTGLSEGQVRGLLGIPEDLTIMLKVAVDDSERAKAQRMLDLLKQLPGAADQTEIVNLQLALDAKQIDPRAIDALIQFRLRNAGINIPTTLAVPATDETLRETQNQVNASRTQITIPATVQPTALDLSRLQAALGQVSVPLGGFNFNQTIVNPPGTPAATVGNTITYGRRNGDRPET